MKPLYDILRAYLQAAILIAATYLFGSTYGGDLIHSLVFVAVFMTLVIISRTCSIYFGMWLEKALDATVIEYDTPTELKAIRTIITGMPGVLVKSVSEGYIYSEGYRLDRNNECKHDGRLGERAVNPRPLGCLLGGIVGTTIAVGAFWCIVGMAFIVISIFLVFFMCGAIFIYGKITSDFDFIDYHDMHPRPDDADLETATGTLTNNQYRPLARNPTSD